MDNSSALTETMTTVQSNSNENKSKIIGFGILFAVCVILLIGAIILSILVSTGLINRRQSFIGIDEETYFKDSKIANGHELYMFLVLSGYLGVFISAVGIATSAAYMYNLSKNKKSK